jgi:epsilon-lactone hydrolase
VPSLRSRIVRFGLIAAVTTMRRRGEGVPDARGSEEQLGAYALRMRAQLEQLAHRLPPSPGSHDVHSSAAPVPSLWVASERVTAEVARQERLPDERLLDEDAGQADRLARAERVTLHLHGGAFCIGSPTTHRGLAGALSRTTHGPVLLPDYRLVPEHVYPAALDDAVATYRWLTDDLGVEPGRIAVTGDSAGGGLGASLLVRLRDEGRPLPACYAGMSPWVDLAATGSTIAELAEVDPWLSGIAHLFEPACRAYAGEASLDDPYVSPIYADLTGLPPMLVHVGTDELMLEGATQFVARARACGVDASLGRFEGLWHVFHAFPGFPESRDALREIGGFVRRHTAATPLRRSA